MRTVTDVITPSVPSDPSTSWRRSGPAADIGAVPSADRAARRREHEADDHLVEAAVAGRRLPGRACGRVAADARALVRLGKVPERVAGVVEQRLGRRAAQPGAERDGARLLVEVGDRVEPARRRARSRPRSRRARRRGRRPLTYRRRTGRRRRGAARRSRARRPPRRACPARRPRRARRRRRRHAAGAGPESTSRGCAPRGRPGRSTRGRRRPPRPARPVPPSASVTSGSVASAGSTGPCSGALTPIAVRADPAASGSSRRPRPPSGTDASRRREAGTQSLIHFDT